VCPRNSREDNDEDDQGEDEGHHCVNPAGHERGWCKHHNRNGYYGGYNGGYNNGGYNGNPNGGYYGGANQTVSGVVTGVNGSQVTILRGLSTFNMDASQAFQRGDTNGPLYATRSITAYGFYDPSGYFHAVSIR
jgi:hypothetical protein